MANETLRFGIPLEKWEFPELDGENLDPRIQKTRDNSLRNGGFIDEEGNPTRFFHIEYSVERDAEGKAYVGRIYDDTYKYN